MSLVGISGMVRRLVECGGVIRAKMFGDAESGMYLVASDQNPMKISCFLSWLRTGYQYEANPQARAEACGLSLHDMERLDKITGAVDERQLTEPELYWRSIFEPIFSQKSAQDE